MTDQSIVNDQISALKRKLDNAVTSRASLESDFSAQSSLLINFIGKLSLTNKGIDIELDNKLAKLRVSLSKSAPISDIEKEIAVINTLLQQYSLKNDQNIELMHEQFHHAGKSLQQINGIPNDVRRDLRTLLTENTDTKVSPVQYIDIFSQLLTFYELAIKTKSDVPSGGLLNPPSGIKKEESSDGNLIIEVNQAIIEQFKNILSGLTLSETYNNELSQIKKKITKEISSEMLMDSFLEIFNVIIKDYQKERKTAEHFLASLSDTLSAVQSAVQSTISFTKGSQKKQNQINTKLNKQMEEMTAAISSANSLSDMKVDLNDQLQLIVSTLVEKNTIEHKTQKILEGQLNEMSAKVDSLEKQSKVFEKTIEEQKHLNQKDALTKLGNRAAFDEFFAKEMVRYHHTPFDLAIVVLDLDDFKRINDTYGHTAGDKTLQVIAKTLEAKLNDDVFVGRYGGEEFVLVFTNVAQEELINELNALKKHIARLPFKFKNNKVSITTSIGASHVNAEDNIHTAFDRADTALYKAKAQGKNQVVYS